MQIHISKQKTPVFGVQEKFIIELKLEETIRLFRALLEILDHNDPPDIFKELKTEIDALNHRDL